MHPITITNFLDSKSKIKKRKTKTRGARMKNEIVKTKIDTLLHQIDEEQLNKEIVIELAESIKNIGLLNPIIINSKGKIVAGRHRVVACKRNNYSEVDTRIIDFGKSEKRQLATIQENLVRNVFSTFERARLIGTQAQILESLGLATTHGGDRKNKTQYLQHDSAANKISKMLSKSRRMVQYHIAIHKGIPIELDQKIQDSTIKDSQSKLLRIAKAAPQEKETIFARLTQKNTSRSEIESPKLRLEQLNKLLSSLKVIQEFTNNLDTEKNLNDEEIGLLKQMQNISNDFSTKLETLINRKGA